MEAKKPMTASKRNLDSEYNEIIHRFAREQGSLLVERLKPLIQGRKKGKFSLEQAIVLAYAAGSIDRLDSLKVELQEIARLKEAGQWHPASPPSAGAATEQTQETPAQ